MALKLSTILRRRMTALFSAVPRTPFRVPSFHTAETN